MSVFEECETFKELGIDKGKIMIETEIRNKEEVEIQTKYVEIGRKGKLVKYTRCRFRCKV